MVDALLDATGLLVAERGVEAVTMRDVVKRAGASPGSLYQYFPSRDALVAAWELRELQRRGMSILSLTTQLHDDSVPVAEALRAVVFAGVDTVAEHLRNYKSPSDFITRISERDAIVEGIVQMIRAALA